MRSLRLIFLTCILALVNGCTFTKVHYHSETDEILDRDARDLKVQKESFKKYKKFVQDDVLFVPQVREIGWRGSHRSFVRFYSTQPKVIYVLEAIGRTKNGVETTLKVEQTVTLEKHAITEGIYKNSIPLRFKNASKAAEVFKSRKVTLELRYWIGSPTSLKVPPETIQFKLKRKRESGSVFDSV